MTVIFLTRSSISTPPLQKLLVQDHALIYHILPTSSQPPPYNRSLTALYCVARACNNLSCYSSMIATWIPQGCFTMHPVPVVTSESELYLKCYIAGFGSNRSIPSYKTVLYCFGESMTKVKRTSDIWWWDNNHELTLWVWLINTGSLEE